MAQQLLASSATNAGHQVAWPLLTAAGGDLRLPGRPDVGAGWTGARTVTDRRTHPAGMQQMMWLCWQSPEEPHLNRGKVWMNCPTRAGKRCLDEKTGAEIVRPRGDLHVET